MDPSDPGDPNIERPIKDRTAETYRGRTYTSQEKRALARQGIIFVDGEQCQRGACIGCGKPGHGVVRLSWLRRCIECGRYLCRICMGNHGGPSGDDVQPKVCLTCAPTSTVAR